MSQYSTVPEYTVETSAKTQHSLGPQSSNHLDLVQVVADLVQLLLQVDTHIAGLEKTREELLLLLQSLSEDV